MREARDRELLGRVRLGETRAFDELVRRHLGPAVRLATRLLGEDGAEDVVQDSFLAVLDHLEDFDTSRPFAPWFYRIVANRCANARRARSRRGSEPLSPQLEAGTKPPDEAAELSSLRTRLQRALVRLPERQRTILLLFDVDGFTGPEIAGMLDISTGTVRWHLHQARAAMRAILDGEVEEGS